MSSVETPMNVQSWMEDVSSRYTFCVERIPFRDLTHWKFEDRTGNLVHETGKFFSVQGIQIQSSSHQRSQPIVVQPEYGILGFLMKREAGIPKFLVQAKMEPGNINRVQISPTVQATVSNFSRVHKGRSIPYLEYFQGGPQAQLIFDQLQPEQSTRFFLKKNRNIVVLVEDAPILNEDFMWVSLPTLFKLQHFPNTLNMDTRSIMSCIPRHDSKALRLSDETLEWVQGALKSTNLIVNPMNLRDLEDWTFSDLEIFHPTINWLSIIATRVEASQREIPAWTQPMMTSRERTAIGLATREGHSGLEIYVRPHDKPGFPGYVCLSATWDSRFDVSAPWTKLFTEPNPRRKCLHSSVQTREGGRFFHDLTDFTIFKFEASDCDRLPKDGRWITTTELSQLIARCDCIGIELRELFNCIDIPYYL